MATFSAEELAQRLGVLVGQAVGEPVTVAELVRQPGGASKDTWTFSATSPGRTRRLVLRADRTPRAGSMTMEADLLAAAARTGVPVPTVVAAGQDLDGSGLGYLVTELVEGETIPRRILSEPSLAGARAAMARQCGRILAAIHRIPADQVRGLAPNDHPVDRLRHQYRQLGQPHPAFELGLRWLEASARPRPATTVVHGDFRNGNFIVGPEGIRAVLDWELAHLGDPLEDLGWLCVRAWRFGAAPVVGGFGNVADLVAGYEAAGGEPVDTEALDWWIAYGTLRWGVICIVQTLTHLSGAVRSVELATIGRRVCEVESDLLELLPWGTPATPPPGGPDRRSVPSGPRPPHDVPSAGELLDAVRDFLETDVVPATSGRVRFHARVAANAVAIVGRELATADSMAAAHQARLARLGMATDTELADAIAAGRLDDRLDEVADLVRDAVADKLAVANPTYATGRPGH